MGIATGMPRSSPDVPVSGIGGCGMGGKHAEQCFETFYTTKREGMGMGLSISRSIVEAHGGHIWCEQNTDRGTTFTFTMPIPNQEQH
jgi:two-component system sensor kinase FixL